MLETLEQCKDRIAELTELLGGAPSDLVALRRALKAKLAVCEIIGFMLKRQYCSRVAIFAFLYGARPECDQPDIKIIDVQMVHVRDALQPLNITVRQDGWGSGSWWLANADRSKLRALMKGDEPMPERLPDRPKKPVGGQRKEGRPTRYVGNNMADRDFDKPDLDQQIEVSARRRAFLEG